ncbi:MAG: chorismate mutase [Emcibacteraceae bacterium]|nr:chorismate mutase [Emcibacteraceae bacterium]
MPLKIIAAFVIFSLSSLTTAIADDQAQVQLKEYRNSIDNIDAAVIRLLAERFKITKEVGVLKANNDLPPKDHNREAEQRARLSKISVDAGLDLNFTTKLHAFIVKEVIQHHKEISGAEQ